MTRDRLIDAAFSIANHLRAAAEEIESLAIELRDPEAPRRKKKLWTEDELAAAQIDDFEFSIRTSNCLRNAGIVTLKDLTERSRTDLKAIKHFGHLSLNEVIDTLDSIGLKLS